MHSRPLIAALVALFVLVLLWQSTFMVRETEYAMNLDWGGKIVRADYAPGLQFKQPLVQSVKKFEKRLLTRNYPVER